VVEKKKDTKARIGTSPDLADAVNLALYEPPTAPASFERPQVTVPIGPPRGPGRAMPGGAGGDVIPIGAPRR
jgi:hypothetical protein